jgi:serine/threonine protein phosphatase 1
MGKTYVISDIHGCFQTFQELLSRIGFSQSDHLYLLGDYIDRGSNSIALLDFLIKARTEGYRIDCLRGNHEQLFLNARQPSHTNLWLRNGGSSVFRELGIQQIEDVPEKYFQFAQECPPFIETEDYLFVHAGINLHQPKPLEDTESLLWIRKWEQHPKLENFLQGKKIIHGHTPQPRADIEIRFSQFVPNYHPVLNIDNGCVYAEEGYHHLCCVDLTEMRLYFQKNKDH